MILHIDMDAFYASVEQLDNPALKGKCVIVGGASHRGVVSAASYEARRFGVRSAMPIFQARKKCPRAVFVPVRMARYKEVSERIMTLLRTYTPLMEPVSIDEAFLDISGCERLFGDPLAIGRHIKENIRATVELSCSIGIAPSKFLAKIASDMDKPDGLTLIRPEDAPAFIETLPVNRVPGVGKTALKKLSVLGIETLGDVRKQSAQALSRRLGKFGRRLFEMACGQDNTPVIPYAEPKSISREQTLETDTCDIPFLSRCLLRHAELVARDLRRHRLRAKTVTLKIKHADFKLVTRRMTLDQATQSSKTVYEAAARLLADYNLKTRVRLIGVGVSGLVPETTPLQADLFENRPQAGRNWEQVDKALDSITQKFGNHAVRRATLTD